MATNDQRSGPPTSGGRERCRPGWHRAVMAIMVTAAFVLTAATSFAQSIATDKLSYGPGGRVTITGKAWKAYEQVTLTIGNTMGTRTLWKATVTASSTGTFSNNVFVLQEIDRNQMLTVLAHGTSGAESLLAFRGGTAPGTLSCSALTAQDGTHYGVAVGETVTCSIEGASDLSAAQQQGTDPVEVLVKSRMGNEQAKVTSVSGNTIYFEYTAPADGFGSSTVSYGPIPACDRQSGKCTTFSTLGNDANSSMLSGGTSAAGFTYLGGVAPKVATMTGTTCYPSTCPAQLQVTKLPQNGTFTQGSQLMFQIQVKNSAAVGSASATNVKLTDQLPGLGGLVWQSATTTQGYCTNPISGNALNCSLGTIAPQATVTVTVKSTATTPAAACVCQANQNATATADGGIIGVGSGTLNCVANPQLKVVKTPDNGTFTQGSQVSFNIVVSNPAAAGSGAATNVKLTDQLPGNGGLMWAGATTTAGTCSVYNNYLNCSLGNIAAGSSVSVTVYSTTTTPATACQYQLNAAANATADGGLMAQDQGSLTCTPSIPPQLQVVKTPDNGTFVSGGQVTYTIVVRNPAAYGGGSATNVQLTDQLPANGGLTWTTVTTTQGACSITNNFLFCGLGTIPAQGSVTVKLYSPSTTPALACQPQPNPVAKATADGGLVAQDSGSQTCNPNPPGQLRVIKTPDNGTFVQGGQVRYTIYVSNPSLYGTTNNVLVTDTLPTNGGLTWTSATASPVGTCSISGGNLLTCQIPNIPAGRTVTITVASPLTTPASACQPQPNPAAIATADGGLIAQDSGSQTCIPSPPPQLRVVKTPDNGTFTSGSQVRFTIVVSNPAAFGSRPATNVMLNDQLPGAGGLIWASAAPTQGTCSIVNNALNCSLGTIAAGASVTVNVASTATTPAAACQYQSNPVALATADGGLTAQDSGSLNCVPQLPPQLAVVKTPDNGTFTQGGQARFVIVVTNPAAAGSAPATNVTLFDQLPGNGGLVWATATPTQGSCFITNNALNCTLGTIAAGASVTVNVASTATTPAAACQSQPNPVALATASGGLTAQDSGSLNCVPISPPQLTVVKTPDNGTFTQGSQVRFIIVVRNPAAAGSAPATNVTLTDQLPGNGGLIWTTALPTQGTCSIVSNALNCSLGTLAAGASATVTVTSTATTPAAACQSQPNPVALATAAGGLTAQDSGSLNCVPPQLSIVKTPDNGVFDMMGQLTYTIVISNPAPAGSSSANNVRLTDTLPGNGGLVWTTATPSQGTCSILSNVLTCTLGSLAPGASATVTVSTPATTPAAACQPQPNPAAVATANGGLRVQDSGSYTCGPPQLQVVKTPDNGTFLPGQQVTFTIVVRNNAAAGASAATNVQLTDVLPTSGGLTWTTATPSQGTCTITGSTLNCSLGTLAAGASATVTVSSPATTPTSACQLQNNAAAIATATGGLRAQDSGSLNCIPCIIPGVTISNTSWNSFPIPAGTSPVVWVHAHIGTPSGIPTNTVSTVRFTGVTININGTVYPLPDGVITFNPAAPATPTTHFNAALNQWETLVNPRYLSNEIFFTGAAIPVTPEIAAGGKATFSYTVQSSAPNLSFPWQWSAAVYTYWPSDWNAANILAYHATYHAGTPLNLTVQRSLVQGPRGGGGSNFTGSWSATGNGTCP
jgi:uncharacterized repeat protein (TIGR01451 family)